MNSMQLMIEGDINPILVRNMWFTSLLLVQLWGKLAAFLSIRQIFGYSFPSPALLKIETISNFTALIHAKIANALWHRLI